MIWLVLGEQSLLTTLPIIVIPGLYAAFCDNERRTLISLYEQCYCKFVPLVIIKINKLLSYINGIHFIKS